MKRVRIWSYSVPYFPAFALNTERHSVSLRIQSKCGKIRTIITPNMETFDAVEVILTFFITAKKTLWGFASLLFPSRTKFSETNFGIKIRLSAHIYMTHIYIYTYTNLRKTY